MRTQLEALGWNADSLGCSRLVGFASFHGRHDLAHVDDAPWGCDEGDGAFVTGAAVGGGAGVFVFRGDIGAGAVPRVRFGAWWSADDSVRSDSGTGEPEMTTL